MHGIREGLIIGLLAFGAYLLLALGTYSVGDPGWSSTGNGAAISNSGGAAGAWIADVLLSLFGYVSYLLPLMLGYRAWAQVRVRQTPLELDWLLVSIRGVGCVLVVISGTGLLALKGSVTTLLPFGIGGMLGETLAQVCPRAFGFAGSQLLLMSLMLFGMTIFTDLSWLRLTEQTGRLALLAWERIRPVGALLWQRLRPVHDGEDGAQEQERAESAPRKRRQRREPQMEDADDTMSMVDAREPVLRLPEIRLPEKRRESGERLLREKQGKLFAPSGATELPPLGLLEMADKSEQRGFSAEALESMSRLLEIKLRDFGVDAKVVAVDPGPVITRFEIQPAAGVKVNRISNLVKDLARSLAVISVRVVEVIPGKSVVGIEIPNEDREMVMFGDVLSSRAYEASKSPLTLALGNDISGEPVVVDLARMPHLLVAGTTGSGKSVGVNAMLLSLLYKSTPAEVRLIMVDPKMLELSVYEGIPHLLTPVITDMKDAANGLRWCVGEMERRYKLMSSLGVRNLGGYNHKLAEARKAGNPIGNPFTLTPDAPEPLEEMPHIVVVIDELADLMMVTGKKIEELIARIAQKARAAGIHLILATQRPSVDVITGLIKANIPSRIAFQVASKVDSRTILDHMGAEALLGQGDMLYQPPGTGYPLRVHGAFVSDAEVHRVVDHLKAQGGPQYLDGILEGSDGDGGNNDGVSVNGPDAESDPVYDQAVAIVLQTRRPSISLVQRHLRIGYNRAARLIEQMERAGLVSPMQSNGNRDVLVPPGKGET